MAQAGIIEIVQVALALLIAIPCGGLALLHTSQRHARQ